MGAHRAENESQAFGTESAGTEAEQTDRQPAGTQPATGSPLHDAASQGPIHWAEDPEVDPPGTPEPLHTGQGEVPNYIGLPAMGTGGH